MANKKITELTAHATPAQTDLVEVVDMSGTPANKKSTLAQIAAILVIAQTQVTGLVAALAAKVASTRSIAAGTGLTGGGDLSADRTISANVGSSAGTLCAGDDARLSDSRTPTAHNVLSASHGDSTAAAAVAGDIIYADANPKWTRLPKGTDGKVLTMTSGLPSWQTASAGTVNDSDVVFTDITTGDVSITKHGFVPKAPNDNTKFLRGDGTWAVPSAGSVADTDVSFTDNTTGNVVSTKHGYAPKSPADATKFLNGAATPAYAQVKDSDLVFTDITTNNVSTTAHGFAPKLPNDATKYLDGTGAYSVPAGSSGGILVGTLDITDAMFNAGNTTPVQVIAAPGAGKVIVPVTVMMYCNVSVSKGANPTQRLRWNGDTTPVADFAIGVSALNLPLNTTGEAYRIVMPGVNSGTSPSGSFGWTNATFDPRNKALMWSQSANTAVGTATGKMRVAYFVADLN